MDFEEFKKYHNANYYDGDSTFDELNYKKSNGDDFDNEFVQDCFDHFKAGQQSKQAEIDALKAKLDDLAKWAEFHIEDYNLSESESEHDRGWFNAACQVFKMLKENKDDT